MCDATPLYFEISKNIFERLDIPFRTIHVRIPPLAEGFCLISNPRAYREQEFSGLLSNLMSTNKTLILTHLDNTYLQIVFEVQRKYPAIKIIEAVNQTPHIVDYETYKKGIDTEIDALFLISEDYILRRFIHQRVQQENKLFDGHNELPVQTVRFIGLGPTTQVMDQTRKIIEQSKEVILFDRTYYNIVKHLNFSGNLHILKYVYEDFAPNIFAVNAQLALLHLSGKYEVSVLIEGNPEIYDLLECLSTTGRRFTYDVTTPLVVLACQRLGSEYSINFIDPGYVLLSGFNARHGIRTRELIEEVNSYMETDLTCMIMEMYCGDIPLILSKIRKAKRKKHILMLTNMFTSNEAIFFLPGRSQADDEFANQLKGQFTTLVIIDNQRLKSRSKTYKKMLSGLNPSRLR